MEDDTFWWDGFALPDLDGWVNCAVVLEGSIVMGGRFTQIGGALARNIARWDGTRWYALGEGFDGDVLSLAVYGGELIASGRFDHSGSASLRGIARWDGGTWAPLGAGLWLDHNQPSIGATALAVQGDVLYAAGGFDRAGGTVAAHVARWNGVEWSAMGRGLEGDAQSLLVLRDSVFVGGSFHVAGGHPASGVAVWDGQAWNAVGGGVSSADGYTYVFSLVSYRGSLVAAGLFDTAGTVPARNLAVWTGSEWEVLGGQPQIGLSDGVRALAVRGDTLLVAGYGLREWDGSAWGFPLWWLNGWVGCLLDTPSGLLVGGVFTALTPEGGIAAVNVGLERGGTWNSMLSWTDRMHGLNGHGYVDVTALEYYRGGLVASGIFDHAGSPDGWIRLASVARWDGTGWSPLEAPPYGVATCLLTKGDTLYAGGSFSLNDENSSPVAMFDGETWSTLDTLSMRATGLALYQGRLYACGARLSLDHPRSGGVYAWDGVHWVPEGLADSPDDFPMVLAMIEQEGRLIAAGSFDRMAGIPTKDVAAWDGHSWSAMDGGITGGNVMALCACDGVLYAGGVFRDYEGTYTNVARWDGSLWERVPGPRIDPSALACASHELVAGGYAYDSTFVPRGIARWDGQRWSPLGSGTNEAIHALLGQEGQLYVGGRFTQAGGRSSFGIARWDSRLESLASAIQSSGTCAPNPFQIATSIAYRLSAPGRVRVTVFDVRGRRVAAVEDSLRPAGTHILSWDGHESDGRIASPGIYFMRLDLGGRIESRRVVRLR